MQFFSILPDRLFCSFENELELPHLPEMVFPKNKLVLTHKNGRCLEFSPLEALRGVQTGDTAIQVACAGMWQGARPDSNRLEKVKPYDWSFSTAYQGTLSDGMRSEETDVQLNIFKLMQKERILFFEDITLFEDELHDHGIAVCSVKIVRYTFIFMNSTTILLILIVFFCLLWRLFSVLWRPVSSFYLHISYALMVY